MYPSLTLFSIPIDVVLVLALGNSFDTSIRSLLYYSVNLPLGTLIETMMVPLLGNYILRYLEAFIGLPL